VAAPADGDEVGGVFVPEVLVAAVMQVVSP
jgi:hypothetical protein